ncbi:MAG: hypothetical protein IJG00_05975 [Clostridia bacterium]|nr:hypothetical protein [Clostridia bacterium]
MEKWIKKVFSFVLSVLIFGNLGIYAGEFIGDGVRYSCLPHSVSATLLPNVSKAWKCAKMDWGLNDEFEMLFFRHGWSSKKVLLNKNFDVLKTNGLNIKLHHPSRPEKTIRVYNIHTEDNSDDIRELSFSIAVDSTEYKLEFSKKLNLMRLTDKADYQKDFYILSGKCYIGHIVATSVSIILDLIV